MSLSEVYLALQQGVVDGQENPIPTIYAQKFHEVCNYINLTQHQITICPVIIGNNVLIAPGAFVNFNVPDNSIVIGNPGKIIQCNSSPTKKYIVYPINYDKDS